MFKEDYCPWKRGFDEYRGYLQVLGEWWLAYGCARFGYFFLKVLQTSSAAHQALTRLCAVLVAGLWKCVHACLIVLFSWV